MVNKPTSWRSAARYALPLSGALLGGALGVAGYTAYSLNRPRPRAWQEEFTFSPIEVQVPFEDVSFETVDGLTIRGWFFPRHETSHVAVCCTGHRGAKHELLGIGSALWRAGNNVLLFDFRGCGDSDPSPISLAHREVADALAAVRYVSDRVPNARIAMVGHSMGAAVAILVAATDPSVLGVVADSSFTSIRDLVAHHFQRHRLPPSVVPLTDIVNRWRYGYRFAAVRPIDVVARISPRPLLFIHGMNDSLIPVEHTLRLYEAAGEPKELWLVDGARHVGAYFHDRTAYVRRVAEFVERALRDGDAESEGQPSHAGQDRT